MEIPRDMYVERSSWNTIIGPTLLCGSIGGLVAHFALHSPLAAIVILAACLAGAIFSSISIRAQAERAQAKLRQPGSHGNLADCGIYADVVATARELLVEYRDQVDEASRLRAELEARNNVRRKQTQQLERAFDSLQQPMLVTDAHGEVRYHNPAAAKLFRRAAGGESDAANADRRLSLKAIPEVAALIDEARQRSAATNKRTTEFVIANGETPLLYRATATNLTDNEGVLQGTATVFAETGEENREKNRHAEFVSSVSHEFKTPMASIKAFTELLADGDIATEEERQEVYGFIESQVDRLTRMVDNMLNLTRVESGVIQVHREDCELNDVLNKALNVVRPAAEEKQIQFRPELSDLYLAAYVDRDLLGQAIINLLSNAVKYTPTEGEVHLRSRMEETEAVIEVSDTGMGIPEQSLPHIFERFYRVPENNKAAAGTGLGLSLVHYIVTELHNGRIAVQSEVGRGTTFTVTLPLGHRRTSRNEAERPLVRS